MSDNFRLPRRVFLRQQALLFGCAWSVVSFATDSAGPDARSSAGNPPTKTGIDVLQQEFFAPLLDHRIGLITNQTGVDSHGDRTIDLFARESRLKLAAIFSPEHGIAGKEPGGASVANAIDAATGVRVFSLFGATRRPTPEMLTGLDALVFDIQDAGVRFYTYVTTMAYAMEEAAKRHIPYFVLDRPNPLGGEVIEGPMLDRERLSFVGYFPMPVRYAMTLGELAQMFNAENKIGADLHVVAMKNWRRSESYADTGLAWIPPSPNLRTLQEAFLYPGIEILEAGGVSVGRGTGKPFEFIGAPWIEPATEFAAELQRRAIPGVQFVPGAVTPIDGAYAGQMCHGAFVTLTGQTALRSMRMGIEIADALHRMYPKKFQLEKIAFLLGSQSTLQRLQRGDSPASIVASWMPDLDKFHSLREKYLIYR